MSRASRREGTRAVIKTALNSKAKSIQVTIENGQGDYANKLISKHGRK
jgi:hypothetical protein